MHNNAIDLRATNNADGFELSGGTTQRKLTVSGADIGLNGSGSNTYTFPSATDTLVGRTSTDTLTNKTLTAATATTSFNPTTSDGAALGSTTLMWSDFFIASGGVINFNNGDITLTHSTDTLTLGGGTLVANDVSLTAGSALRTRTSAGNTMLIQARDVDGAAYTTFITLTANNTPTCDLATSVTMGGNAMYYATGTDVPLTDGGTGASTAAGARANLLTKYVVSFNSISSTPAASTTYYFGATVDSTFSGNTTAALRQKIIPFDTTLRGCGITIIGTPQSVDTFTIYARINNTTDVTLTSSAAVTTTAQYFSANNLAQAITAGDKIEIKVVTPAWATPPTAVRIIVDLYFE